MRSASDGKKTSRQGEKCARTATGRTYGSVDAARKDDGAEEVASLDGRNHPGNDKESKKTRDSATLTDMIPRRARTSVKESEQCQPDTQVSHRSVISRLRH